jgi:hypothetical protein
VLACLNLVGQAGPDHGTHLGALGGVAPGGPKRRKRNHISASSGKAFAGPFYAGGPPVDFVVCPGAFTICNGQLVRSLDQHWARIVAQLPKALPEAPLNA